jgi:hypothetical protein
MKECEESEGSGVVDHGAAIARTPNISNLAANLSKENCHSSANIGSFNSGLRITTVEVSEFNEIGRGTTLICQKKSIYKACVFVRLCIQTLTFLIDDCVLTDSSRCP